MIKAVLVVVLALWAFCTYLLPAVVADLLPDVPDLPVPSVPDSPRGDGFGPFPLPNPVNPFAACTTPAQPRPTVRGGLSRAVSDAGSAAHRLTTGPPPDVAEVRSWLLSAAGSVGSVVGTFEAAFQGRPYVPPAQQVTDPPPSPAPAPSSGVALAARAAASAGWTGEDLVTAVAIPGPESGYVPTAANPTSSAAGLWQVMVSAHGAKIAGRDILDPYVNAAVAYQIWQEAGGFSAPWPTFRSGAHLPYMDAARAAVAALPGSGVVQAGYTPAAGCEPGVIPAGMPAGECPAPEGLLTPETVRLCRIVAPAFGVGTVYGWGLRGNATEHDDGRALDFMVYDDQAKGQAIADYVQANAEELDVLYIVWRQQIWSVARADEGWRAMEDRGGDTANHMDHPHVSLEPTSGGAV